MEITEFVKDCAIVITSILVLTAIGWLVYPYAEYYTDSYYKNTRAKLEARNQ